MRNSFFIFGTALNWHCASYTSVPSIRVFLHYIYIPLMRIYMCSFIIYIFFPFRLYAQQTHSSTLSNAASCRPCALARYETARYGMRRHGTVR